MGVNFRWNPVGKMVKADTKGSLAIKKKVQGLPVLLERSTAPKNPMRVTDRMLNGDPEPVSDPSPE